jgi:hypothetical protein
MAAGFSPMPSRGGAGNSPPLDTPQSPSSMLSQDDGPGSDQPTDTEGIQASFIKQVRDLHTTIDAMARQFPEFAKAARDAQDALTKGMSAVVSKQRGPQGAGAAPMAG